ncbi:MAG: LIC12162 family protein [Candidatus Omnitrophota bacterium]
MAIKDHKSNDRPVKFLVTTALEDFWDTSKPIIFLEEGCLRYSRKSFWQNLEHELICSPLRDRKVYAKAYAYIEGLYEQMLLLLAQRFNAIHGTDHGAAYWRIVIGPWLMHYLFVLYERYVSLKSVLEQHPDFVTWGLAEKDFVTPENMPDFIYLSVDDPYNVQIYTRILGYLKKEYVEKSFTIVRQNVPVRASISNCIFKAMARVVGSVCRPVVVKHPYFSSANIKLKVLLAARGSICFDYNEEECVLPNMPLDFSRRQELASVPFMDDDFGKLLAAMLPLDVPKILVEGYAHAQRIMRQKYPRQPKAIVNSDSWSYDDIFKMWAADCAQRGIGLYGLQHGGDYGILTYHPLHRHEVVITRKFYSWGLGDGGGQHVVSSMPSTRMMGRRVMGASNEKKGVLLATSAFPRYVYRFQNILSYDNEAYLAWQHRFAAALDPVLRRELRVRLFVNDRGCDCEQRWKDQDPDVRLERFLDMPFLESLEDCRIHVSDNLGTTYLDGLTANKPTMLFWDPQIFAYKPEIAPYFDDMRKIGILHDSPEAAASAVGVVYADVEAWWNDPCRQAVIKRFCDVFGKTSPTAMDEWAAEFRRIAKEGV